MIGSNTLIVKEKGLYRVHQFGGWPGKFTVLELAKFDRKHRKTSKELTETEAYQATVSHQCNSEFEPAYSQWCGDGLYVLDLDRRKIIDQTVFAVAWEAANPKELARLKRELASRRRIKRRKVGLEPGLRLTGPGF